MIIAITSASASASAPASASASASASAPKLAGSSGNNHFHRPSYSWHTTLILWGSNSFQLSWSAPQHHSHLAATKDDNEDDLRHFVFVPVIVIVFVFVCLCHSLPLSPDCLSSALCHSASDQLVQSSPLAPPGPKFSLTRSLLHFFTTNILLLLTVN